jgi:HlyD family secretion protein
VDIQRGAEVKRAKQRKRILMAVGLGLALAATTYALSRLQPAAPSVDRSTVWPDTVKRGEMLRNVRGLGTLVPEEIRWIPATTQGRVERIILRPGALVKADSVILELTNPELEQEAVDAELQLKVAQADYENLRVQLESQLLTIKSDVARAQADFTQNTLQAKADEALFKDDLISRHVRDLSANRAAESTTRYELEKQRLANFADSMKAQLAARQAQVDQRKAYHQLKQSQLHKLRVRAGFAGVLQALPVEVGQQVAPGTNLARVSDPTRLKAEVRIAETQARDIVIGQVATVDTRNGVIHGRVSRIDPAATQGTVLVDITLEGALPQGARPDLSVDGTIELERLTDVLYVGRPVQGQPNSTIGLFKMEADGVHASRVQVKLGRTSVNTVEIVEGLREGETVILSDMSQYDNVNRIRLN